MRPVLIAAVVVAGCAVASAIRPAHSQPPERLPELKSGSDAAPAPGADPHARVYGVGHAPFANRPATSCAAASCHGGGAVGKVGSEHTTWSPEAFPQGKQDPHAKAYRVLFNPVSVEMAKKLGYPNAHTAAVCLKCHAVETGGEPDTRDQVLAEGVGCSACHGPAEKWIGIHYTSEWKALSNREKWEKYGFVPAGNLVARTLNCAGCHIGDSERDLNHDLYAAGHPRITFEAARLHNQDDYRKHWTEKTPQPDFELRAWLVGQAAGLRAATHLLHERATRAAADDPKTPWPEFSGYSCYACHQQVGQTAKKPDEALLISIRGVSSVAAGEGLRPAGSAGWEVWNNTATEIAAKACGDAYPGLPSFSLESNLSEVKKLRELMEKGRMPGPKAVAAQSAKARQQLDAWLAAMQAAEDDRSKLKPVKPGLAGDLAHKLALNALAKDGAKLKDHDWDALTANYLGAAAMYHAGGGAAGSGWLKELTAVRDGLRFPPPADGRFDSPALTFDRLSGLRTNFTQLRDATKGGK